MAGGFNSDADRLVGKDSALVQAYEEDSAGNVKIRLADKISGKQQLSKMTGGSR